MRQKFFLFPITTLFAFYHKKFYQNPRAYLEGDILAFSSNDQRISHPWGDCEKKAELLSLIFGKGENFWQLFFSSILTKFLSYIYFLSLSPSRLFDMMAVQNVFLLPSPSY